MRYSVNLNMVGLVGAEPVTLLLKITILPNVRPPLTAPVNTINHIVIDLNSPPVIEGNAVPPIQVNSETTQPVVVTPLLPLSWTRDLPNESSTSM
jgi:hypothetical protein